VTTAPNRAYTIRQRTEPMKIRLVERKFTSLVVTLAVTLCWSAELQGAAISGKVTDVTDQTATVSLEDLAAAPAIGDSVEIFFNLAGADVEVSVASGQVMSVGGGMVRVKIEHATGDVAKDQFARITSQKTNATAESSSTAPPTNPEAQAARARRKPFDEATDLYNRGDFDGDIAIYTKIIEAQPNGVAAYGWRAKCFEKKSEWSKALDDLNHAIDLDGSFAFSFLERAEVRIKLQDFDSHLLEDCNKLIALDQRTTSIPGFTHDQLRETFGKAYLYRGIYYAHKGDAKSAIADWDRATVLYPALQKEVDENRALIPQSPKESPVRPEKRPG
jgi:tetratricopeptide (TPR) repeat protein